MRVYGLCSQVLDGPIQQAQTPSFPQGQVIWPLLLFRAPARKRGRGKSGGNPALCRNGESPNARDVVTGHVRSRPMSAFPAAASRARHPSC